MVASVGGDPFRGVIDDAKKKRLTVWRRGALVVYAFGVYWGR